MHTIRPSILFISDRASDQAPRHEQLAGCGWRVLHATDRIEALKMVRGHSADLAVADVEAADLADTDLPDILRQISHPRYLPVVGLVRSPAERDRCELLDGGLDDVIPDWVSGREMTARLAALLRVKALHDDLVTSEQALQAALARERELMARLEADNQQLRALAATDPLTHLQNVRAFRDLLAHEYKVARRYDQPLSLLMLDVDHFKLVNDTYGHPTGDYILKELAVILTRSVRESDVVARTGGEEFAVILPQADPDQAAAFAERIRQAVRRACFTAFGREVRATISIGAASYPANAEIVDPDMLTYFADQALLIAKETGRDRVVTVGCMADALRCRLRRQYQFACGEIDDSVQDPAEMDA